MIRRGFALAGAAFGLWVWGCGGAERSLVSPLVPPPRPGLHLRSDQRVVLRSGEQIHAEVEMFGLTIGKLEMRMAPRCSDASEPLVAGVGTSLVLTSNMDTAGILAWFKTTSGHVKSLVLADSLAPTQTEMLVVDAKKRRLYSVNFRPRKYLYNYHRSYGAHESGTQRVPQGEIVYDMLSAFFALRSWQPPRGTETHYYVVLGKDLWLTDVTYHGSQIVDLKGKRKPVIKISGTAKKATGRAEEPRSFQLWLSADAERLPLRVTGDASYGTLEFHLVSRKTGLPCQPFTASPASSPAGQLDRVRIATERDITDRIPAAVSPEPVPSPGGGQAGSSPSEPFGTE